ncbi:DNA alkylation repair protein [Paenibacillus sp. SC116]|uniref:DNA alkylation repair protein n=1 Tax=Paenibacillus sp. SC116 TaxID=2968986 RepID=UPI00215A227F|nr:DNA alkylation repair protein [Paenibacillus sp. SC116]MCR8844567.1 DNA alkylation repair protein [Paenibacillus sp. SC116]
MSIEEIMSKLEELGTEQTKMTFLRHGAEEPLFGVKVGDMKKLVKYVKKDQELALALYETGNYDAMYLAGLSVRPKLMTKDQLQRWVSQATWHAPAEYTVASVAAESNYALELAREWIRSDVETTATCGWSTYSNFLSIAPDEDLDIEEIRSLLGEVERTIHQERNRVRYTMNGFVISVGTYVEALHDEAKAAAAHIGKVHVDVGNTACKVPLATAYIDKVESMNRVGQKRKTCIC